MEIFGWLTLSWVFLGMVFLAEKWRGGWVSPAFESGPFPTLRDLTNLLPAVIMAIIFGVPILSHIWHLWYGEGSLTDYTACAGYSTILDYGCIYNIPSDQYWINTQEIPWWEFEGALINTWEFTVAIELFILKLVGALWVFIYFYEGIPKKIPGWNAFDLFSNLRGWSLYRWLVVDAFLSLLIFSDVVVLWGWGRETITIIGLFASMAVFALALRRPAHW